RKIVRQIDDGQSRTHFVLVATEQVVMADRDVEEVSRRDARRIVIVVFGSWRWHPDKTGAEGRCWAIERQWRRRGCALSSAREPRLGLLIGRKWNLAHVGRAHTDVIHAAEHD